MSVDEEEAFASVELDDLLAGFYRDPVAVASVEVVEIRGEEVKSCPPPLVSAPPGSPVIDACHGGSAETNLLLNLLGGVSASALVVGYSDLTRAVYEFVVGPHVGCRAGIDLSSRLLGGKSAGALLAGYQLFIRSELLGVRGVSTVNDLPVSEHAHSLCHKYMEFLVEGFSVALGRVDGFHSVEQAESLLTTATALDAVLSRVKSPLEVAIRLLVGDSCADKMIWSPHVALILLARFESQFLTPLLSRVVSGQSATPVVFCGSPVFSPVVGSAFSLLLGGQSSGNGLSHSPVLPYALDVLVHRMHTLFEVFNTTWRQFCSPPTVLPTNLRFVLLANPLLGPHWDGFEASVVTECTGLSKTVFRGVMRRQELMRALTFFHTLASSATYYAAFEWANMAYGVEIGSSARLSLIDSSFRSLAFTGVDSGWLNGELANERRGQGLRILADKHPVGIVAVFGFASVLRSGLVVLFFFHIFQPVLKAGLLHVGQWDAVYAAGGPCLDEDLSLAWPFGVLGIEPPWAFLHMGLLHLLRESVRGSHRVHGALHQSRSLRNDAVVLVTEAGIGCSFPGGGRSVLFCGACATTKQQGEALSRSFVGGGGSPFPPVAVPGLFPGSSSAFLPIPFSAVRAHGVGDRSFQSMVFCLGGDLLSGGVSSTDYTVGCPAQPLPPPPPPPPPPHPQTV
jgi:hypothetical protein